MAVRQPRARLQSNADRTISVFVGRAVEHVGVEAKSAYELTEAVKWAFISKGVYLTDESIDEMLRDLRRRTPAGGF